jgi:membrane-associated phospholipid phosphatase
VLALMLHDRPRADWRVLAIAVCATVLVTALALLETHVHEEGFSIARDWVALALVFIAYRTLDLFSPAHYQHSLELAWQQADHLLLHGWRLRSAIEYWAPVIPDYLEICYLLTSGAGCYALAVLYLYRKRNRGDQFLLVYLLGALISYALVPFLRLEPPRVAFPTADLPGISTAIRTLNLVVLSGAGIHSGVFPSAHVSSTFAAAWGMFYALPERKRYGWIFLVYAASVAIATVYGRYHYAADALAGIAVSIVAILAARLIFGMPTNGQERQPSGKE